MLQAAWATDHKHAVDILIEEIRLLNPDSNESWLRKGLIFNQDGTLHEWNLKTCELYELPGCFGTVRTTGDLVLWYNQLRRLPESFGSVSVGRNLYLDHNQLRKLPASFSHIRVGGTLSLEGNHQLEHASIPTSFPNVRRETLITI